MVKQAKGFTFAEFIIVTSLALQRSRLRRNLDAS
jgi:hypothetical protein